MKAPGDHVTSRKNTPRTMIRASRGAKDSQQGASKHEDVTTVSLTGHDMNKV